MSHIRVVAACMALCSCGEPEISTVHLSLSAIFASDALAQPVDEARVFARAPDFPVPIVARVDRATQRFSMAVPAGRLREFQVVALRTDTGTARPTYVGRLVRDLLPGTEPELVVPAYAGGGVAGRVVLADGRNAPQTTLILASALAPPARGLRFWVVTAKDGRFFLALPTGGYHLSARLRRGDELLVPVDEPIVAIEHGALAAEQALTLRVASCPPGTRIESTDLYSVFDTEGDLSSDGDQETQDSDALSLVQASGTQRPPSYCRPERTVWTSSRAE